MKRIIIPSIIMLILAIIYDSLLMRYSLLAIKVDATFTTAIFSALVTIGVLGVTILSVVINSYTEEYLGIKIKSIINFRTSKFKLNTLITISFSSIAMSILFYALGMVNTLIIICLFLIIFLTYSTAMLWNYLSKENELHKAIKEEIICLVKQDSSAIHSIVRSLSDSLNNSIKSGKTNQQKQCLELLGRIHHEYKDQQ